MTEKYYSISSYVYVANNPVKYIDPDGRIIGTVIGAFAGGLKGAVGAIGKAAIASTQGVQQTMSKSITSTATTLTSQGASQGTVNAATSSITKGMSTAGSNTANSMIKVEGAAAGVTEAASKIVEEELKKFKPE